LNQNEGDSGIPVDSFRQETALATKAIMHYPVALMDLLRLVGWGSLDA